MSHEFYDRQWQQAMEDLAEQIETENPPPSYDAKGRVIPEKPIVWEEAFAHYSALYIRYIQIMRKLEDSYDQIIHPQKRRDIKKALETSMARIVQIKRELVRFGPNGKQSDYLNLEELLIDLKLPPEAVEIPVPRYFRDPRARDDDDNSKKREMLEKALEEAHVAGVKPMESIAPSLLTPILTRDQAIKIILKNERGRQGAQRAKIVKKFRDEDALHRRLTDSGQHERDPTVAATLIQKSFRGFSSRIRTHEEADKELAFIGMRPGDKKKGQYDPLDKEKKIRRQRKAQQADNELKYIEALHDLEKSVADGEGPEMKDAMWDERYHWWIEQKRKTGKYPDSFDLFYKEKNAPVLSEEEKKKLALDKEEDEKQKAIDKRKRDRDKRLRGFVDNKDMGTGKKGSKKGAKSEPSTPAFTSRRRVEEEKKQLAAINSTTTIGPSPLVTHALEAVAKYKGVWSALDESENYHQTHDENLARDKLRPLVRDKIQKEVDITLLRYLDNIKLKVQQRKALARKSKKGKKGSKKGSKKGDSKKGDDGDKKDTGGKDNGEKKDGDGGGGAAPAKKVSKKKKVKKGSKKKKKPCCIGEALVNRIKPQEELIPILVKMGILQELKKPVHLTEFIGPIHLLGTAYAAAGVNLDPSMSQIRQCLTEYCILPLGSSYVKEQTPLLNTLLLYGPSGSGKTLLSKAIASETGATWFDLSPKNIERKLGTKSDIARMVHMVFQVAIDLAPSVIYIDDVDKVFVSAKSKKTSDIVKMKNFILQHKSSLTRNHRVLVIGNTRVPYHEKVDRKDLNRFFGYRNYGKMMFCPCPSYASRLTLWKHFITETGMNVVEMEKNSKFDLTTLANISEGYSAGSIQQAVQAVLPHRRVAKLVESGRSIDNTELITALSKTSYTYKDDYISFQKFTDEVTGEKERRKLKGEADKKAAEEAAVAAASKRRGMVRRRPTNPGMSGDQKSNSPSPVRPQSQGGPTGARASGTLPQIQMGASGTLPGMGSARQSFSSSGALPPLASPGRR